MKKKTLLLLLGLCLFITIVSCDLSSNENNTVQQESYEVDDSFFTLLGFEPNVSWSFTASGGALQRNTVKIYATASLPLTHYTASINAYDSNDSLLYSERVSYNCKTKANEKFSFVINAPLEIQSSISYLKATFSGKTSENPQNNENTHKIILVFDSQSQATLTVKGGERLQTPSDPQKSNHIFCGWYTDESFSIKYDFSKAVTKSFSLYAKYEIDAATITNKIMTDSIRGVVKVYNTSYNTFLGIETASVVSQGSGFCFYEKNGFYYILTNCHVAKKSPSYEKQRFVIEDYQGNTYTAYLYKNPNKNITALSAEYDLACLYFESKSTNVKKLSIAEANPTVRESIISLGAPRAQSNSITYGWIESYTKTTLSNTPVSESNVSFDVIYHNSKIDTGSSGGPLLNSDLVVVGINYAVTKDTSHGCAIPAIEIHNFLSHYVYD